MADSNVVRLKHKTQTGRPVELIKSGVDDCKHLGNVLVREDIPHLECGQCHVTLDPYWYIRQVAKKCISIDYRIDLLQTLEAKAEQRRQQRLARKKKSTQNVQVICENCGTNWTAPSLSFADLMKCLVCGKTFKVKK